MHMNDELLQLLHSKNFSVMDLDRIFVFLYSLQEK